MCCLDEGLPAEAAGTGGMLSPCSLALLTASSLSFAFLLFSSIRFATSEGKLEVFLLVASILGCLVGGPDTPAPPEAECLVPKEPELDDV